MQARGFWRGNARKLDDVRLTDIGRCASVRARYSAVEVASVLVASSGEGLSLAASQGPTNDRHRLSRWRKSFEYVEHEAGGLQQC
jgi:hypothetical protein